MNRTKELELTRIIMKYTCSDETKTEEAESLTPIQDALGDSIIQYKKYMIRIKK